MFGGGNGPTVGGFISFVVSNMGLPAWIDPATDPDVVSAYDYAVQFVNVNLCQVPGLPGVSNLYALAVYNLAADTLINYAQDPTTGNAPTNVYMTIAGQPYGYWAFLRNKFGVNSFAAGVVSGSSDEGTSVTLAVPKQMEGLTFATLQNTKTPYGRQYLAIAGSWGSQWGIS